MVLSTNNTSASLMTAPNSTMATCVPCLYVFPQTYVAALISSCLLTLPLRGWALWQLVSPPITKKTDLFSVNLMVSDLLLTLVILLTMSDVFLFQQFFQYTWIFLLSLVTFGRPLFQSVISLERYLAVEHPTVFLRYRPLRYRVAIVAPVWISVLIICSMAVALCVTQRTSITDLLLFQCTTLLLIFVINSFSSVSILKTLIRPPPGDGRRERERNGKGGKWNKRENLNNQIKNKVFGIALMVQLYGMTCYLPIVVLIFSAHVWEEKWFCGVYMFNLWFSLLTSCFFCLHHLRNKGKLTWIKCPRTR